MSVSSHEHMRMYTVLREILLPYVDAFAVIEDIPGRFALAGKRRVVIEGKRRAPLPFASLAVHRQYVSFYFMPLMYIPHIAAPSKALESFKSGKLCFHFTREGDIRALANDIDDMIARAGAYYGQEGWL